MHAVDSSAVTLHAIGAPFDVVAMWLAGAVPQAAGPSAAIAVAASPSLDARISIQPFGTPGQRSFVGSYGSMHLADPSKRVWSSS